MMGWKPNSKNQKEDLNGMTFGLLTVIGPGPRMRLDQGRSSWMVRCMCGETFNAVTRYLKRGTRNHCGKALCKMFYLRREHEVPEIMQG